MELNKLNILKFCTILNDNVNSHLFFTIYSHVFKKTIILTLYFDYSCNILFKIFEKFIVYSKQNKAN